MKIKWNWGTGIFLTLVGIILFLAFLVSKTFEYKINKVSDDYYDKGLNHSEHMNRVENSILYNDEFQVIHTDVCTVKFPTFFIGKEIKGNILFFRPSDYERDRVFEIKLDKKGSQTIELTEFLKGRYIVRSTFTCDHIDYFLEEEIIF
ncbi:MAG: FixH family protein [Bacteroidales bacterium]|nr:FixH family protein [Bacteroidales bacterium]